MKNSEESICPKDSDLIAVDYGEMCDWIHDLNNMLAVISMSIELLDRPENNSVLDGRITKIANNCESLRSHSKKLEERIKHIKISEEV